MLLDLRRPADVLFEQVATLTLTWPDAVPAAALTPTTSLALNIKAINTLGRAHADATAEDPRAALERYHDVAMAYQNTGTLCALRGLLYVTMVFAAQGG